MNLHQASNQWASRPPEERFWTLEELEKETRAMHQKAVQSSVRYKDLRVEADAEDLYLVGNTNKHAKISHFSFGQMCSKTKTPAHYLRQLPPTLAAQNLNFGLKMRGDTNAKLLFHKQGEDSMVLRAALSERYSRIWNFQLARALTENVPHTFKPPVAHAMNGDSRARPAIQSDLSMRKGGFSVREGDMIGPAGIYASDKDLFVFLVDEDRIIEDGTPDGLARGIMIWNSEIGDRSFGGMSFHYKAVCGNHIVWGAQDVFEFKIPHIGEAASRGFNQMRATVLEYQNAGASETELQIKQARQFELGANKTDVLEAVLGFAKKKNIRELSPDKIEAAFDIAEEHRDWYNTPPSTVWGMVNGLTEVAQQTKHTDRRVALDRASGKVMEMAF